MVMSLPSMVMSPFFFIVIDAEPVFSTISSPAETESFLPTSRLSFSPIFVDRSLPTDVVSPPSIETLSSPLTEIV